jgi:hypothetical protein
VAIILETRECASSVAANNTDDRLVCNVEDSELSCSIRPVVSEFGPDENSAFRRLKDEARQRRDIPLKGHHLPLQMHLIDNIRDNLTLDLGAV